MDILAFFGFIIIVSLSGVLMPGPMTAATVVRSYSDKWAGAKVAIGHALVEFPLLALIAILISLGWSTLGTGDRTIIYAIGVIGGAYLIFFGVTMLRDESFISEEPDKSKITRSAVVLGITTTLFNPGFILWWLMAGSLIVAMALEFGIIVLIVVAILHWSCDFAWGLILSFGIQKAKQFYASKIKDIIRYGCAALILFFGAYFAVSSAWDLLT